MTYIVSCSFAIGRITSVARIVLHGNKNENKLVSTNDMEIEWITFTKMDYPAIGAIIVFAWKAIGRWSMFESRSIASATRSATVAMIAVTSTVPIVVATIGGAIISAVARATTAIATVRTAETTSTATIATTSARIGTSTHFDLKCGGKVQITIFFHFISSALVRLKSRPF